MFWPRGGLCAWHLGRRSLRGRPAARHTLLKGQGRGRVLRALAFRNLTSRWSPARRRLSQREAKGSGEHGETRSEEGNDGRARRRVVRGARVRDGRLRRHRGRPGRLRRRHGRNAGRVPVPVDRRRGLHRRIAGRRHVLPRRRLQGGRLLAACENYEQQRQAHEALQLHHHRRPRRPRRL